MTGLQTKRFVQSGAIVRSFNVHQASDWNLTCLHAGVTLNCVCVCVCVCV